MVVQCFFIKNKFPLWQIKPCKCDFWRTDIISVDFRYSYILTKYFVTQGSKDLKCVSHSQTFTSGKK